MSDVETDDMAGRVWCFQCGSDFDEDVEECIECGVPTSPERPMAVEDVGGEDEDQLAYELHEWSGEGRSILRGMLARANVSQAWQGATLIVREADEEFVDNAISQTEVMEMPTLDLTQPTVVYELAELDDDQNARLLRRLGDNSISHAFDGQGDLHVYERDEEVVDALFEGLDDADISEREFGPGIPGVNPVDVIGDLFVATGRVNKKPTDAKATSSYLAASDSIEQLSLPYGFNAETWARVVDESGALSDALAVDSGVGTEELVEMAGELQAMLRTLI